MCFGNNWLYFMWFKSQIDVKFGSLRGRLEKDLFFSEVNCHGLFFTWINFFSSYFAKKATKIFFQGKLTRHLYLPREKNNFQNFELRSACSFLDNFLPTAQLKSKMLINCSSSWKNATKRRRRPCPQKCGKGIFSLWKEEKKRKSSLKIVRNKRIIIQSFLLWFFWDLRDELGRKQRSEFDFCNLWNWSILVSKRARLFQENSWELICWIFLKNLFNLEQIQTILSLIDFSIECNKK